jgi:uncharacterized protein
MIGVGYIGAFFMGLSLGLLGGGGSILTVPLLVYVFHVDPVLASAYSLFIVGLTASIGCVSHVRAGNIDGRTALLFGLPGVLAVVLTRRFVLPIIPDPLVASPWLQLSRGMGLLLLLAVLMVLAARHMLRNAPSNNTPLTTKANEPMLMLRGGLTGLVTSLVGVGGGFLVVPALTALAKLPMKKAIGTSLLIIAANGLIGAAIDPHMHNRVDWSFLLTFSTIAVAGTLVGSALSSRVPDTKLRPAFGWFILAIGIGMIWKELSAA